MTAVRLDCFTYNLEVEATLRDLETGVKGKLWTGYAGQEYSDLYYFHYQVTEAHGINGCYEMNGRRMTGRRSILVGLVCWCRGLVFM